MTAPEIQIIEQLAKLIQSKQASSYFINGSPGSGKTHLLKSLSQKMPDRVLGMVNVLGPFTFSRVDQQQVGASLLSHLWKAGYLIRSPDECHQLDLASIWHWIDKNSEISSSQVFVVLIDLPHLTEANLAQYCEFLSNVRSLESTWRSQKAKLCHIVAGFWDSERVRKHVQKVGVSFPYTESENYNYWHGVNIKDISVLLGCYFSDNSYYPIMLEVLFELTDGNPLLAGKILSNLPEEKLNFTNLLLGAKTTAWESGDLLIKMTCYLDEKSKSLLRNLLVDQYLPSRVYGTYRTRLLTSGLVKEVKRGADTYLRFRSWLYEIMVRLHGHKIGIPQDAISKIQVDDLPPWVFSLNQELAKIINDIETQSRNFVVIQQSLNKNDAQPLLSGLHEEYKNGSVQDAHHRAKNWRERAKKTSVFNELNPIVSYLSTGELAEIIKELASIHEISEWKEIGKAVEEMAKIRNAVMHNQLVNDKAIDELYRLQGQIYAALKQHRIRA